MNTAKEQNQEFSLLVSFLSKQLNGMSDKKLQSEISEFIKQNQGVLKNDKKGFYQSNSVNLEKWTGDYSSRSYQILTDIGNAEKDGRLIIDPGATFHSVHAAMFGKNKGEFKKHELAVHTLHEDKDYPLAHLLDAFSIQEIQPGEMARLIVLILRGYLIIDDQKATLAGKTKLWVDHDIGETVHHFVFKWVSEIYQFGKRKKLKKKMLGVVIYDECTQFVEDIRHVIQLS